MSDADKTHVESKARDQASGCKKGSTRKRHRKEAEDSRALSSVMNAFKRAVRPGVPAQPCNPATSEARLGRSRGLGRPGLHSEREGAQRLEAMFTAKEHPLSITCR